MAEVTAMRNNALPYPVYGVAFTLVAPLLDADGDPISPSSPDSEVSKNGDTFADCTNEATEIATSSGVVYLTLTATEMTADVVAVRIQSTGAKTTVITLYPRKLPILATGTCQGSNDTGDIQLASGDSAVDDIYNGCLVVAVIDGTTEARIINDYVGSTKVAEVSPAWNTAQPDSNDTYTIYQPEGRGALLHAVDVRSYGGTAGTFASGRPEVNTTHAAGTAWNSGAIGASTLASDTIAAAKIASGAITSAKFAAGAIDAAAIANGAIDSATFAADVDAEILSYIVDDATRIDASALNTLSGHDPGETIMGATDLGTGSGLTSLATAAELAKVPKSDGTTTWNSAAAAQIQSEANDALVAYDPPTNAEMEARTLPAASYALEASVQVIDGIVDAIKLKTDNLPSDPADASDIAAAFSTVNSTLATIAGYIDTEIGSLVTAVADIPTTAEFEARTLAAASYALESSVQTVDGNVDAIKTKTDQLTFTVANVLDSNILYVNGTEVGGTGAEGDEWGPA